MSLASKILYFDKEEISNEEIIQHVKHYYHLAQEGLKNVEDNKPAALLCLSKMNETLKEEYYYYKLPKVQTFIKKNRFLLKYYSFVTKAFAKQENVRAFRKLDHNLSILKKYAEHYFGEYLT